VTHHHRRRYRADQLRKVVSEAGYEICYLSYYNFVLFTPIFAARLIERLTGVHSEDRGLELPPRPLNWLLWKMFAAERLLLGRVPLPLGVSLIVLARNPVSRTQSGERNVQTSAAEDRASAIA
jgi:hypothetical protein